MSDTRSKRGLLTGLALALFSVCITLLVIEAGFRLYQRVTSGTPLLASLSDQSLGDLTTLTLDNELGWKATPNFHMKGIQTSLDGSKYPVQAQFDARGFREFGNVDAARPKIFVIGDSVTQAVHVSDGKTYYDEMGRDLDAEIFAYGAGGYGSLQEYMILDKYLDEIKPDLIVWQFCPNDLVNNDPILETNSIKTNNGMTRPYLVNDRVEYIFPKRLAFVREFALHYSRLLYWVLSRYDNLRALSDAPDVEAQMVANGPNDADFQRTGKVLDVIMSRVRTRAGNTPIVSFTCSSVPMFDELFRQVSEKNGIRFTVESALQLDRAAAQGTVVRVSDGGHYNENGNRVVGQALADFIKQNQLLVKR